jgi:hypothetical protein
VSGYKRPEVSGFGFSPSYTGCSNIDTAMLLVQLRLFDGMRPPVSTDEGEKASPGFKAAEEMVGY